MGDRDVRFTPPHRRLSALGRRRSHRLAGLVPALVTAALGLWVGTAHAECPLLDAAADGDAAAVRARIAAGDDVNCRGHHGVTPLGEAAYHGHTEVVRILAAAGADLEARDERVGGPLMNAVAGHRDETFDALIALGADPNATDRHGWTVLMRAVKYGRMHMVKALIGMGVDLDHESPDRATAYRVATATHRHLIMWALRNADARRDP